MRRLLAPLLVAVALTASAARTGDDRITEEFRGDTRIFTFS